LSVITGHGLDPLVGAELQVGQRLGAAQHQEGVVGTATFTSQVQQSSGHRRKKSKNG
jgi:hypothetical protein